MKKRFSNLKVSENKLNLELTSEYAPLAEDPSVIVVVEHLRNGEMASVLDLEDKSFDMPKLFLKKVKEIRGIEIEDKDGNPVKATPRNIVEIPDQDFSMIVLNTCTYILSHSALDGDEVKN